MACTPIPCLWPQLPHLANQNEDALWPCLSTNKRLTLVMQTTPYDCRIHFQNVSIVIVTALLSAYACITGLPFIDWMDAVAYQATGRYMVEYGVFMPEPLSYSAFLEKGIAGFGMTRVNYPNYLYELSLGFLGVLRGDFSLVNGIVLSAGVTLIFALLFYRVARNLLNNAPLALVCTVFVLTNRVVQELTARPLSDLSLLIFGLLAFYAAFKMHSFLAGLILGCGYLFREHAILLLLFIPLASPATDSLRGLVKTGIAMGLGFVPGFAAAALLKGLFTVGEPQANLYASHFLSVQWFSHEAVLRLLSHSRTYAANLGIVLCIVIAISFLLYAKLSFLSRRALLIGTGVAGLICLLWTMNPSIPERYLAFSIILFGVMVADIVQKSRHPVVFFCLFMASSLIFRFPPAFNTDFATALLSPRQALCDVLATIQSPAQVREFFPPNSIVLESFPPLAYIILDEPVVVSIPAFEDFLAATGNDKLDGIWLRGHRALDWPDQDRIADASGIRFQRIVPTGTLFPDGQRFYARVKE